MGILLLLSIAWIGSLPLALWLHRQLGWYRANFRGDLVPCSLGIVPFFLGALALLLPAPASDPVWLSVLGFGLLGWLDDRWGQKAPKGIKGHLRTLLQARPSTGILKLGGGLLLAALIAWQLTAERLSPLQFGARTLLIALTANFFNLLDLRPGRAATLFCVVALAPLSWLLWHERAWTQPALWVYLGVLRILGLDQQGQGMMGDTGSNLIGATAGVLLLQALQRLLPPPLLSLIEIGIVISLVLFHLWAERSSLTQWIESHPWARRLDQLTGKRE